MPKVNVYNQLGEVVGDIELNEAIFGIEVNEHAFQCKSRCGIDYSIQDSISGRDITIESFVPICYRQLACKDGRLVSVSVFYDFH